MEQPPDRTVVHPHPLFRSKRGRPPQRRAGSNLVMRGAEVTAAASVPRGFGLKATKVVDSYVKPALKEQGDVLSPAKRHKTFWSLCCDPCLVWCRWGVRWKDIRRDALQLQPGKTY